MPRILVAKEDGLVLLKLTLTPERSYTVGRSKKATIRLDAPSVSRLHAMFFFHDGKWVISDLNSTRGIWTEGGRQNFTQLVDGAWIAIGPAFIWFSDDDDPPLTHDQERALIKTKDDEVQRILLVEGPEPMCPQAISLDQSRALTIGSGKACDVVIGASDLEPLHVCVLPFHKGWYITSIGEVELIRPDGLPTRTMALEPENTVFAGSLSLSLITVRKVETHIESDSETRLDLSNERMMVPPVDLEAAAKSGSLDPPERPAAA